MDNNWENDTLCSISSAEPFSKGHPPVTKPTDAEESFKNDL
jgi:hypothetical protein